MVYFGPIRLARQYFIDMGYVPANRQTTADFLVSVTDPCGRTMIAKEDDKRDHPIPQTAVEFEEYFKNSEIMKMNLEDIRSYKAMNVDKPDRTVAYKESAKAEHARHTRATVSKSNSKVVYGILSDRFFFQNKRVHIRFQFLCKYESSCFGGCRLFEEIILLKRYPQCKRLRS